MVVRQTKPNIGHDPSEQLPDIVALDGVALAASQSPSAAFQARTCATVDREEPLGTVVCLQ